MAAFADESIAEHTDHGADLDYGSETANTFLKHMRENETLQAILRFGRDKESAVVFAHISALAESLPIVSEGGVIKAFSQSKKEAARALLESIAASSSRSATSHRKSIATSGQYDAR